MSERVGSNLVTVQEIFEGNLFRIPDYQRGYAWRETQVLDLLKDIEHMGAECNESSRHYTGTLVVTYSESEKRFLIVDGQQRLTTLVLLMHCIAARIETKGDSKKVHERYVGIGKVGSEELVFEPGKDSLAYFRDVIVGRESEKSNPPENDSQENLVIAKRTITKWLDDNYRNNQNQITYLQKIAEGRLGMLVYKPDSSYEVGMMFEVINNRGRPLTELEKVKNYLIYIAAKLGATTTQRKINDKWSEILVNLYKAKKHGGEEDAFLRAAAVVFFNFTKKESSNIYGEIKAREINLDQISKNGSSDEAVTKVNQLIEFLSNCSRWYMQFICAQGNYNKTKVTQVLERIRSQDKYANVLPLIFALLDKLYPDSKKEPRLLRLLELIETFNFRVYVTRNSWRTDWGQGPLYKRAGEYWNGLIDVSDYHECANGIKTEEDALEAWLVRFAIYESGATDEHIKSGLLLDDDVHYDFYRWPGLKYFLVSYEDHLQGLRTIPFEKVVAKRESGKGADYYSIEHIWSTNHEKKKYSSLYDRRIKSRLGNFCLIELNLNSAGSDLPFEKKLKIYREGQPEKSRGHTQLAQVIEALKEGEKYYKEIGPSAFKDGRKVAYRDLHKSICEFREKRFCDFAAERWALDSYLGYEDAMHALQVD